MISVMYILELGSLKADFPIDIEDDVKSYQVAAWYIHLFSRRMI